MFDVGFSELLVIGIVALVVIGPEKLPRVARTVGALLGRMQRYVNDVKADISREIELDELKKMQTTVQDAASSIQTSMNETVAGFQSQTDELNKIASGDVSGLMDTKPAEAAAGTAAIAAAGTADAPAETPALTAADAAVPAVSAESASVSATASTSTSATMPVASASADVSPGTVAESSSHQTSQASLFAESAAPNHARSAADSAADTGVTSKPAATV